MKKLIIILCLLLCGCGETTVPENQQNPAHAKSKWQIIKCTNEYHIHEERWKILTPITRDIWNYKEYN